MNYREFITIMKVYVQQNIQKGDVIQEYETIKNNGVKRTGLVCRKPGINMSPTIYMEEFYEQYLEGAAIEELAESICDIYQEVGVKPPVSVEDAFDYQKIKDKIAYKLIHKDMNKEFLKEVPYEIFEDLAVVPYVVFEETELGIATLQIRNEHLKSWGIDAETVLTQAVNNSSRILPMKLGRITEYMYVMTNETAHLGAATMLYPNALKWAYERIGENIYILPSSIHEVILVPESFGLHPEKMSEIVKEINEIEVSPEEILSHHVYYYIGEEQRIISYYDLEN